MTRADSLKPQLPPQPPQDPDTVRKRLSVAIDNLAGVLYISMGKPDSAGLLYRRLLNEFPESPVAPRALYVLARIEGEDSAAAPAVSDSLYHLLIDKYPTSVYADEARRLIGIPPVQNISDLAEGSYARGENLLKSGNAQAAIDTFTTLARTFPQSPAASRALYAAGWTYENQTPLRDSAAAVYERLISRYPNTTFAQKVQPRVREVQVARQQALDKAKADSLAKAKAAASADSAARAKAVADSTARVKRIAPADSAARAKGVARADSAARGKGLAPADSAARAKGVSRADSVARGKGLSPADSAARAKGLAPADSAARGKGLVPADSAARAKGGAPADTVKAGTDETDRQEQLHEERRKARAKPAVPARKPADSTGKPTRPPEKPEEKPID